MTAASLGAGPNTFSLSLFSGQNDGLYRARRETFVLSLRGQAALVGVLIYFTSCVIRGTPEIGRNLPKSNELLLVFSGPNGGGGDGADGSRHSVTAGWANRRSHVAIFPSVLQWPGRSRRNRIWMLRWRWTVNRARIRARAGGNLSGGKDGRDHIAGDL